jgi:polyhydroxybutyrate depolymerase
MRRLSTNRLNRLNRLIGKLIFFGLLATVILFVTSCTTNNGDNDGGSSLSVSGCGKRPFITPGTSINQSFDAGGIDRLYRLHIPRDYQNNVAQPLVLNFHGHNSNAYKQEQMTGMSYLADHSDFVVAYPQGTIGLDHHTGWNTGPWNYPHVNDVSFTSDLITHLQSSLCINTDRIYAMGFSNGGGLTNDLACKLSERIAAFAIVSGGMHPVPDGCHPSRPVSLMEIHGTGDLIVPYQGNVFNDDEPSITAWMDNWSNRDHCTSKPTVFLHQANLIGEQWTRCQDNATVIHYRVKHEGHMWPVINFSRAKHEPPLHTSVLIWQFFQQHTLRRATPLLHIIHHVDQSHTTSPKP